jgi:hypothetical protein
MLLVVPVLGALGIQGLMDRPMPARRLAPWFAASVAVFLVAPLAFGAYFRRYAVLLVALPFAGAALAALASRWRRATAILLAVLALELGASAITSQTYRGGTVLLGLESTLTVLTPGPLKWPDVSLERYLDPGPIARALDGKPGRFLTWVPPANYYIKGYLFTQDPVDWMALENGRGMLFGLRDSMGYSPVQLTRYWSYIRATNDAAPLFYNAAVLQHPSLTDARLLGIRWLIAPSDLKPPLPTRKILRPGPYLGGRYTLYRVAGSDPLVSVVPNFRVAADGGEALRTVLRSDFDPARRAVVQIDPGIDPSAAPTGTDRVRMVSPEDIRISARAAAPSLVVIRNSFDTGWHATVDGRPAPVLAADYFLQAVPIPRGRHVIRLVYRDPKIGEGIAASGVVWGLLVLAAAAGAVRERRRRGIRAARRGNGRGRYSASLLPSGTGAGADGETVAGGRSSGERSAAATSTTAGMDAASSSGAASPSSPDEPGR